MKEVVMKSAPVPESPAQESPAQELPRIVVVVSGGVVNEVLCDTPAEVVVLDYDEIEASDPDELEETGFFCFGPVDGAEVDEAVAEARKHADSYHQVANEED